MIRSFVHANQPENSNLTHLRQLATSFSGDGCFQGTDSSLSWFGVNSDEPIAIWANNSSLTHGCITPELAEELDRFLDLAEQRGSERIILLLDSAGVALNVGWEAMRQVSRLIKRLLALRIDSQVATIAVLGDKVGCFGGAFLLASSCQYVVAQADTECGVSGQKVINHLNPNGLDISVNRLFYQTSYRLLNGEVFTVMPEPIDQQCHLLQMLKPHTLNADEVRADYKHLCAVTEEDRLALDLSEADYATGSYGFADAQHVGCDELLAFISELMPYLEKPADSRLPIIMGNCEQAFSFLNEQRGFSRYLNLCMKLLRYLSAQGHKIRVKVDQRGHGASFIALSMMADTLIIEEGSHIIPLPLQAVDLFLPSMLLTGHEWRSR